MESFLISLCMKILEVLLKKGTAEFIKYQEFRKELVRAGKYREVVDKPGSTREERRKAEDDYYG